MKIKSLSDEQVEQFSNYVSKWIEIGISTEWFDVDKSLAALRQAYENVDMVFPEEYEVYDSPIAAINAMKEKYGIDVNLNNFLFGCHEATWLSFYNFFQEQCGIEECDRLTPFMELAKHCGWVLAFDSLIVLTKKPTKIKFDDENRAHCEDGFAIEYSDGFGVAMWHGVRIPKEWIFDKSSLTPDVCLHHRDVEQRRCACEIVGWANVLENLHAVTIDQDMDPTVGTLVEVELPEIGTERFLIALDPNVDRQVGLPVPSEMQTALEANAWTYQIDLDNFKPAFRV